MNNTSIYDDQAKLSIYDDQVNPSIYEDPANPTVTEILLENERRNALINTPYHPVIGDSADPCRVPFSVEGLPHAVASLFPDTPDSSGPTLYIPREMLADPLVRSLEISGSLNCYISDVLGATPSDEYRLLVAERFVRLRICHDFPFWCAVCVYIKPKGGGPDTLFSLNRPQRRLVATLEKMRRDEMPIRLVLLKARQWGGSTCVQLYMAWLQMVHATGLNSLIIAHQGLGTDEIKNMFDRMLDRYPERLLADEGENPPKGRRMENVGGSRGAFRVVHRNCKVKLGSAERPDSCRGGDYNLIHCSEVGIWRSTRLRTPEQIIRAACSGVLLRPMTMIVLESTANGTGNYFHREYEAAKRGESQFKPLFISWYDIDQYTAPLPRPEEFAESLIAGREATIATSDRRQPGAYLWWLWQRGATLEAINWYVSERSKYSDHGQMASEYPSDDVEAFVHSGARVFDKYKVEALRPGCRIKPIRGEIDGDAPSGPDSLAGVRFNPDDNGAMRIWKDREPPQKNIKIINRYLAVVDIGGRSDKADWSVITVFDRDGLDNGALPEVVAQWRGHTDIDLLAWNAARIARYYHDALLVIESNTLDTRDPARYVDGDQSMFILNQLREAYPNLYARSQSPEEVVQGVPRRYGFHTNTATKPMIISGLVKIIREGGYVERDEECLDEYLTYERRQNGSYGALPGRHDDLLMTRAIGLHICFMEMEMPRSIYIDPYRNRPREYSNASQFVMF